MMTRALTVVSTFETGRGTAYCVKAPESGDPYHMGEIVFIDNVLHKIIGVEMMLSNPPQPIYRGYQSIMLERIG